MSDSQKALKIFRENPEKALNTVKKVILKNRVKEDLTELFYLIPVEKRDIINKMVDLLEEVY